MHRRVRLVKSARCPATICDAKAVSKTPKLEDIYPTDYGTFAGVAERLPRFIEEVYNAERLHSAPGYRSPAELETQLAQQAA